MSKSNEHAENKRTESLLEAEQDREYDKRTNTTSK